MRKEFLKEYQGGGVGGGVWKAVEANIIKHEQQSHLPYHKVHCRTTIHIHIYIHTHAHAHTRKNKTKKRERRVRREEQRQDRNE